MTKICYTSVQNTPFLFLKSFGIGHKVRGRGWVINFQADEKGGLPSTGGRVAEIGGGSPNYWSCL